MEIKELIENFKINGEVVDCRPLGNGHINYTFLLTTDKDEQYVFQRINNSVFKDVDGLMNNIFKVTNFLENEGYETLKIIKTKDDKLYYENEGKYYRVYVYNKNTICYEGAENLKEVYDAGKAFGKLHKSLAHFNASSLVEVIPHFHDTYQRYLNLLDAIKEDKKGRVKTCLPEIEILKNWENEYSIITDGIKNGEIRLGVTHNDPKINNVLFDKKTGDIRAVVDLDTVMPGSYLFDYGDAIRGLFSLPYEDSKDLSKLYIKYDVFESYTKGYLSEMKNILLPKEKELLAFSAFLLTVESAIRFLEDYIRGDVYFHTEYPEHNLVRTRTQIKLSVDIHNDLENLNNLVAGY
ncbi:MAG: phosphotransferase [Bacilli bacterium]|nr:phosphotransferase [Bacilli bacterium]